MHWVEATDPEECTWGFLDLSGLIGRGIRAINRVSGETQLQARRPARGDRQDPSVFEVAVFHDADAVIAGLHPRQRQRRAAGKLAVDVDCGVRRIGDYGHRSHGAVCCWNRRQPAEKQADGNAHHQKSVCHE